MVGHSVSYLYVIRCDRYFQDELERLLNNEHFKKHVMQVICAVPEYTTQARAEQAATTVSPNRPINASGHFCDWQLTQQCKSPDACLQAKGCLRDGKA